MSTPAVRGHGVELSIPETDGPVDLDDVTYQTLMMMLGAQASREVQRARFRTTTAFEVETRDAPGVPQGDAGASYAGFVEPDFPWWTGRGLRLRCTTKRECGAMAGRTRQSRQRAAGQPADPLISYHRAASIQRQLGDRSREAFAIEVAGRGGQVVAGSVEGRPPCSGLGEPLGLRV